MRIPGRDPFDVRTANADVSQFTIGQVREFAIVQLCMTVIA